MSSVDTNFGPLQIRIDARKMKRSHVAALTGLSAGYLSQAASGQTDLSYPDFRRIEQLLDVCDELQRRAGPIPIDWRNISVVKDLIRDYENESKNPPGDLTQADWNLLSLALESEDPSLAMANLGLTPAELLKRLDETNRRFEGVISKLKQSTDESRDLMRLNREEFEAHIKH